MNFINQPKFSRYERSGICQTLKIGGDVPLCEIKVVGYTRESKVKDRTRILGTDGISQSLRATDHKDPVKIMNGYRIRKLTPKECWRLQGVPDEITNKVIQAEISDTQMYRGAGDACTVNVIYEIAKKLA